QIVRQRRIGVVDRLVLTDHAAQLFRERAGAGLERGVRHHLVGLHRERMGRTQQRQREDDRPNDAHALYSAGCIAGLLLAGRGAPTRNRRSESESPPPTAITAAPNQISSTSGW